MNAAAMKNGLMATNYFFKDQTAFYRGKVRDVYSIKDEYLVVVACDRISAFDHVLPKAIPFKGQVLTQIAAMFLEETKDIVPNWLLATPDPNVSVGLRCEAIPVEMVIRGYLAGHAWREYKAGRRKVCGVKLPDGLKENDKLPTPIITPATKNQSGHDEDISLEDIVENKIVSKKVLDKMVQYTHTLFEAGTKKAADKGLILVDTKYEFGLHNKQVTLIDEVHTPDSSRFFYADTYEQLQNTGKQQRQLSKEFVREWLMANGFQGLKGEIIPEMTPEFVDSVTQRYIELYEAFTVKKFDKRSYENIESEMEENTNRYLASIL